MGLAALHWSQISLTDRRADQAFYQNMIEQNGGKALELGCGAGRLLLTFLKMGLDVEGVDISPDQLATCRKDGEAAGLTPVVYEQKMQELNVLNRYNTISGNLFNRFFSDDPDNACPIYLGAGSTTSIQNIITNNHFGIQGAHNDPPALGPNDGICGDTAKISKNTVDNNFSH